MNIIGAYFEIICLGCPFLEKETLEGYLYSKEILQSNRLILALVFSIQTLVEQRFGFVDLAFESYKKTLSILPNDKADHFYSACVYVNLGIYLIGEGKKKEANFYAYCSNYYFKNLDSNYQHNEFDRNLIWFKMTLEYMSSPLYPLMDPQEIIDNYKIVLRHNMPLEWQEIVMDMKNSTISNVESRVKVYQLIAFTLQGERRVGGYGVSLCEIIYLSMHSCISISFYSFVDPIYFKDLIYAETVKASDLTEYELFAYSAPQVIINLLIAIKVHLEMLQLVESGQIIGVSLQDYYKVVAKNYRAVNILRKKYRVIDTQHADIVTKLEQINKEVSKESIQQYHISNDDKMKRLKDFESQLSSVMKKFIAMLPFKENSQPQPEIELDGLEFYSDMFLLDDTSDLFLEF